MLPLLALAAVAPATTVYEFTGAMPTGVTVSREGRIFVTFPRWGDRVPATLAEIRGKRVVPYPNATWNRLPSEQLGVIRFTSVQSAVVDPKNRLWALDTGSIKMQETLPGAPKLVCFNLRNGRVERTIRFPESVVYPTTYLNDVRFDLTRGKDGYAFITDSSDKGPNGIIVVDLASGESWRRLNGHPSVKAEPGLVPIAEGRPLLRRTKYGKPTRPTNGSDGIAIDVKAGRLYYCALIGRRLYSVDIPSLVDRSKTDDDVAATVRPEATKGASDGLLLGPDGRIWATDYEHHRVVRLVDGRPQTVIDLKPFEWPDTLALGPRGSVYLIANQLQRMPMFAGKDLRRRPYRLVRASLSADQR